FLRDWLGLTDPNAAVYTFAGHVFNWVGVTHIIFSIVFAVGYCSRNFLNPPYIFLRDWLGLTDPNAAVYTFAGHVFNWVGVTHII
ncbi:DUF1440 domain-containing protein, partial [Escherichia coli]|uniref:DUF1440 domain-containing protein n=1 Tax=Escherichia coli TaxID=562 RepID=UPI00207B7B9B